MAAPHHVHLTEAGPITGLRRSCSTFVWAPRGDSILGCLYKKRWQPHQPPGVLVVLTVQGAEVQTQQPALSLPESLVPSAFLWSANAAHIAVCDGAQVRIWAHQAGAQAQVFSHSVSVAAWSPAGHQPSMLLCCRSGPNSKGTEALFCSTEGALLGSITSTDTRTGTQPLSVAWGAQGVLISSEDVLYVGDVQPGPSVRFRTGAGIGKLRPGNMKNLQRPVLSPDGAHVVLCTDDQNSCKFTSGTYGDWQDTFASLLRFRPLGGFLNSQLQVICVQPEPPVNERGDRSAVLRKVELEGSLRSFPRCTWASDGAMLLVAFDAKSASWVHMYDLLVEGQT